MPITGRFTLEKLTIGVYEDRRRIGTPQSRFKVMYNPESFSIKHTNDYHRMQGINTSGRTANYVPHSRRSSSSSSSWLF